MLKLMLGCDLLQLIFLWQLEWHSTHSGLRNHSRYTICLGLCYVLWVSYYEILVVTVAFIIGKLPSYKQGARAEGELKWN